MGEQRRRRRFNMQQVRTALIETALTGQPPAGVLFDPFRAAEGYIQVYQLDPYAHGESYRDMAALYLELLNRYYPEG